MAFCFNTIVDSLEGVISRHRGPCREVSLEVAGETGAAASTAEHCLPRTRGIEEDRCWYCEGNFHCSECYVRRTPENRAPRKTSNIDRVKRSSSGRKNVEFLKL